MNDPVLGFVIGLIVMVCYAAGYKCGYHMGRAEGMLAHYKGAKASEKRVKNLPRTGVSWLRRNWFKGRNGSQVPKDAQELFEGVAQVK